MFDKTWLLVISLLWIPKSTCRCDDSLEGLTKIRKAVILTVYPSKKLQTKVNKDKRQNEWVSGKTRYKLPVILFQWSRTDSTGFSQQWCATAVRSTASQSSSWGLHPGLLLSINHMAWTIHVTDLSYAGELDKYSMAHRAGVKKKCFLYKLNCWRKLSRATHSVWSTKQVSGSACLTGVGQGRVLSLLFWGRLLLCSSGKSFSWAVLTARDFPVAQMV